MSDIINPYIAGNPVTGPEMFFGREDVFRFIHQALIGEHRDNVIVLYGQRRTGKTSVLYQVRHHLDARYLCIFVDLHGFALEGLGGFLWELANHIIRVLHRDHQLELSSLNRATFIADPRSSFASEFLNQVWSVIGDRHILLMLDEAVRLEEQVQAGKLEREIFEYMRHLMQHYERLNFLFSLGSGLEEMEAEYAFLFNVALYKKISFLERDAAIGLITQPVEKYYRVEPDAVERILQITSGHPYYTQLICHCLFNRWQQKHPLQVDVQDVNESLDEVVERGLAVLKHVWDESTMGEKTVLAGMATAMDEQNCLVGTDAINHAWTACDVVIPKRELARAIRGLITRDVIVGQDEYMFTVDLQRLWVQKYRRLEWVNEEIADVVREWSSTTTTAPRKVSRRMLLVGLAGLVAVGSGITWLALSKKLPFVATPTPTPSPTLTPTPTPILPYIYRGHFNSVYSVGWSPDGTRIASGSGDQTVQVWDASNGNLIYTYRGHIDWVYSVGWSPDGTRIASGSSDQTVQVWDASNGNLIYTYRGHRDSVYSVAWSPHNTYIASGSGDQTVQVWDATTGNHPFTYRGHVAPVYSVTWSPDGTRIASGSVDKMVKVWNAVDGGNVYTYRGHSGEVRAVAWSPDGRRIASASVDKTVQVWDAADGGHVFTYRGHTDHVLAVAWSPDGRYIASGSVDTTVQVWDAASGNHTIIYRGHVAAVSDVEWSPDGQRIASASRDTTVQVWEPR